MRKDRNQEDQRPAPYVIPVIRVLLQLAASIVTGLTGAYLMLCAYVNLYALRQGVELSELSEDYGMGFYSVLIALGAFVTITPIAYAFIGKLLKRIACFAEKGKE